jgi:hypothetical protein
LKRCVNPFFRRQVATWYRQEMIRYCNLAHMLVYRQVGPSSCPCVMTQPWWCMTGRSGTTLSLTDTLKRREPHHVPLAQAHSIENRF